MESIDISKILNELIELKTLGFIAIVAVLGAMGGFAKKFTTPLKDRDGDRNPNLGYIIVGSTAAIAILLVITPTSAVMLVALSLAAGYAGRSVLDNLGLKEQLKRQLKDKEKNLALSRQKREIEKVKAENVMENAKALKEIANDIIKNATNMPDKDKPIKEKLSELSKKLELIEISFKEPVMKNPFVIILDEDFENDTEQYIVVYETDNLKDAQSQTQYYGTVGQYPRDVYKVMKIRSITLEHTETGTKKDAAIYKLSF
jgi:hypothetical protein